MKYSEYGVHRWFARNWVWRIYGFTHWSSGAGNYTFDPNCPWCKLLRFFRAARKKHLTR